MTDNQKGAMSDLWDKGTNHDGHVWVTWSDVENCIVKLIEKQIPMHPVDATQTYRGDVRFGKCPSCGNYIDERYNHKTCDICNQAVDWSEEYE